MKITFVTTENYTVSSITYRIAIAFVLGWWMSACANLPAPSDPLPTATKFVSPTPQESDSPPTPSPVQTTMPIHLPKSLGKIQFFQDTYILIREDDRETCDSECPSYIPLLSDVYTWLYVHPKETYLVQFHLDSGYQLISIDANQPCQINQDSQDVNSITIACADTGEHILQLAIQETSQNVQYSLNLNVFSIPDPGDTLISIPPSLWFDEYELAQHPETEPRSFVPVKGTAAGILSRHEADRGQPIKNNLIAYLESGQTLQAIITSELTKEMSESGEYPDDFQGLLISITQDGEEIFSTKAPVLANNSLKGLWAYENHWFIEVIRSADTFRSLTRGEIYEDGQSLNEQYGYTESFGFQLMHGKPFYFFERDGLVGIVYDGQEYALGYYRVLHNGCCSSGVLNPVQYENMVGFFAVREDHWVYTEIGAYENPVPTPIPAQNGWTREYTATVSIDAVEQATPEEIASLLFTQWLDHFQTPDADSQNRLDKYELIEVKIPDNLAYLAKEQGVNYVVRVEFSVKPTIFMYSNWLAGNGTLDDKPWIQKSLFIGVVKEGDIYRLKLIGTSP